MPRQLRCHTAGNFSFQTRLSHEMNFLQCFWWIVRCLWLGQARVSIENLALRQQLAAFKQETPRPRLRVRDRLFWVVLSRLWKDWRSALIIVEPDTVVRWHRLGFRLFWRWKSASGKRGRPKISAELRELIRRMTRENVTWGAPRIAAELALLGHDLSPTTVAKYMVRPSKPLSPTWKTCLKNHAAEICACDFFVVPTATFRVLYVFVRLHHASRRIAYYNVTEHPSAQWTAQQIVEAFPFESAPRYLLHDHDSIYGAEFRRRAEGMGMEEVKTGFRSPWQNPYVERVIGSIRRECLDHMIVPNAKHLRRIINDYLAYYHGHRAHQGLCGDTPLGREREPPDAGEIVSIPLVGGLHHR